MTNLEKIINENMILPILDMDKAAFEEIKALPENLQNVQFINLLVHIKFVIFNSCIFKQIKVYK